MPQRAILPYASRLVGRPWAITPDAMHQIAALLGVDLDAEAAATSIEAAARREPVRSSGGTAVIPVTGPLLERRDPVMEYYFGATSYELIRAQVREAMGDSRIRSVIFDVDSPGGMATGLQEITDEIYAFRGRKPMTAIANTMMGSAALHLASAADEIVASPSSLVGSVGTMMVLTDISGMAEQQGIKVHVIATSPHKGEGVPGAPVTDETLTHLHDLAMNYHRSFVSALARGRGATASHIEANYGQGRMLSASAAKNVGMVDRIATFSDVLARHGGEGTAITTSPPRDTAEVVSPVSTERLLQLVELGFPLSALAAPAAQSQPQE